METGHLADILDTQASDFPLDSTAVVLGVAAFALLATLVVPLRWDAWRIPPLGRSLSILAAVFGIFLSSGLLLNRAGDFYPTLGSLIGSSANPGAGTVAEAGVNGAGFDGVLKVAADRSATGKGSLIHLTVQGSRTAINRDVDVYLPAGYGDPAWAGVRYPVIEWFPHWPGEPRSIPTQYGLTALLDSAIASHRMSPAVVVIPDPTGQPRLTHDSECVDAVGGLAADTYLSADIRDWTLSHLRVRADRLGWALAGWSSGGYCAMNLALRHPQWYATAVSMSGYEIAAVDASTGDLFRKREDIKQANNVATNLRLHPAPIRILATAGAPEAAEIGALDRLKSAARSPIELTTWVFPSGGHNINAVKAELPSVLEWLGEQIPGPVPAQVLGPNRTVHGGIAPWALPDAGSPGSLHGTVS